MFNFLWLACTLFNKLSLEASFLEIHRLEQTHKHALEACLDLDRAIFAIHVVVYAEHH